MARWLRSRLSIQDETRADPDRILAGWGIPIAEVSLSSRDLDAISIWGPKHGPAVVVNRNARHGRMKALRATLAHEVGHMVLDRLDALPVCATEGPTNTCNCSPGCNPGGGICCVAFVDAGE